MSLLMQALRKAERAKQGVQLTEPQHEQDGLQLAPIETDIQRAAAGSEEHPVGGPAFSLEPMEPALTAADLSAEDDAADIPVIPATEVVHDPVPPQARPGARRSPAVAARAAAEARLASDMPHGPRSPGGLGADEAPHAASPVETAHAAEAFGRSRSQKEGLRTTDPLPRTPGARMPGAGTDSLSGGFRGPAPGGSFGAMPGASAGAGPGATAGMPQSMRRGPGATRAASAASNRRLAVLVGLLVLILLAFGFIYFRAVGGRPGAALPPVPMLPPGTIAATPGGVPATVIPGVDATRPGAVPTPAVAAAPSPSTASPGTAPTTPALPEPSPGAAASHGAPVTPAAHPSTAGAVDTATIARGARAGRGPAPPTRPNREVIIPTPEALAAIQDPAIRAEAMRDAEERAARAARDAAGPHPAGGAGDVTAAAAGAPLAPSHAATPAAAPLPADAGDVRITRNNAAAQVSPAVQNGWSAYNAGDLTAARQQYDTALLQDPNNRDALLGSAAVAIRERNGRQAAANYYVRLLELDPNDAEALAGLVALRPGDIEQAESKLKATLQRTPESGAGHFALGNLYARQGRWPEAQQSYFRAFTAAPTNPDYAFNLAVGLDRLNQGRLAQSYYQRALALAQAAPAGFDPNAVRKRLQELGATAP